MLSMPCQLLAIHRCLGSGGIWQCKSDLQLLQVTICDIVAAPIRNGIELDAVGELHLVLLNKPAPLCFAFCLAACFTGRVGGVSLGRDVAIIDELDVLAELRRVLTTPSSILQARCGLAGRAGSLVRR